MRSLPSASLLALLCAAIFGGCATHEKKPEHIVAGEPPPVQETHTDYVMAPLDRAILKLPDGSTQTIQITNDGTLDFQRGLERVNDMPVEKFRAVLRRRYPDARIVSIEEFRPNRVTVLGEVFHQIHTELTEGPMRVMDAIASANGFTPLADKRHVKLLRQNAGLVQVFDLDLREMLLGNNLTQNILLKPGDVITVPRNFL